MKLRKLQEGFTLVELMVVVAIIGILSAVAIPNFKKYQAKSKTSEARLQLASVYTAEISFSTDFDSFASCLSAMGYTRSVAESAYYSVGFGTKALVPDDINGSTCKQGTNMNYPANKKVGNVTAGVTATWLDNAAIPAAGDTFIGMATGVVDAGFKTAATADKWTVNETKNIAHTSIGY